MLEEVEFRRQNWKQKSQKYKQVGGEGVQGTKSNAVYLCTDRLRPTAGQRPLVNDH
jgi:hypothetical protein